MRVALIRVGLLLPLVGLDAALRLPGPIPPGDDQTAAFSTASGVSGGFIDRARAALQGHALAWRILEQSVLVKLASGDDADPTADDDLDEQQRQQVARRLFGDDSERPVTRLNSGRKARGWAISEALLWRLRDFSAALGTGPTAVETRSAGQVTHPERTMTPLPTVGARLGLPVIDLLETFRAQPRRLPERLYSQGNQHWVADGQALVARTIAAALDRRGMVP